MKALFPALWMVALILPAGAIPNSIFGPLGQVESPLNDQDLTDTLLGNDLWVGALAAPGNWQDEASVAGTQSAYLLARPKVFGEDAVLVRRLTRDGKLEELQITFADAGSFFGYFDKPLPKGLTRKERAAALEQILAQRQEEFRTIYAESAEAVRGALSDRATGKRVREEKVGRSRTTRAVVEKYELGDLEARVLASPDRLVRVSLHRAGEAPEDWMDRELSELSERDYLAWLKERVGTSEHGDLMLEELEVVPQGYKPYCGLNTLTMAARYLGLHLDEDWLAAAGQFQNTGSAAGSRMLSLYSSVANEARLGLKRSSSFDANLVRKSLEEGLPVVVWRRWSQERDQVHTAVSRAVERGSDSGFDPDPDGYPDDSAPLHASVIVGYHEERDEFLFLESWSAKSQARRMPADEMEATAYLTFCFRPN